MIPHDAATIKGTMTISLQLVHGAQDASVTSREEVDAILLAIAPRNQPRQIISMPPPRSK